MKTCLLSMVAIIVAVVRLEAAQLNVQLQTDKLVYQTAPGQVQITLKNASDKIIVLSGGHPLEIRQGSKFLWGPIGDSALIPIPPGKSMTWSWNKNDTTSKIVAAGSYEIVAGPIHWSGPDFYLKRTISITPTGKIAGSSYFPLTAGNHWAYRSSSTTLSVMGVALESTPKSGIFLVNNLLGGARWVQTVGGAKPILMVRSKLGVAATPLLYFNRPKWFTHYPKAVPFASTKFVVTSTNMTIQTPAATFHGCTRIDVHYWGNKPSQGYESLHFAPGIGLVQFTKYSKDGIHEWSLVEALLKGSDGNWYKIGTPP